MKIVLFNELGNQLICVDFVFDRIALEAFGIFYVGVKQDANQHFWGNFDFLDEIGFQTDQEQKKTWNFLSFSQRVR